MGRTKSPRNAPLSQEELPTIVPTNICFFSEIAIELTTPSDVGDSPKNHSSTVNRPSSSDDHELTLQQCHAGDVSSTDCQKFPTRSDIQLAPVKETTTTMIEPPIEKIFLSESTGSISHATVSPGIETAPRRDSLSGRC